MATLTIKTADLPKAQFTAGSLLKQNPGAKLADVRAALDALVETGQLTRKTASSGAVNYKVVAEKAGRGKAAKDATTDAEWETSATATASTDKVERVKLAKAEAAALKEYERTGNGTRPATPNLDAINAKAPTGRKAKADGNSTPRGTTVQFLVDGKPMPSSQNKLSSVAWYHTKGIGGDDVARIDVKALRDLFTKAGVADPSNTVGVSVTLPNGKVVTTTKL